MGGTNVPASPVGIGQAELANVSSAAADTAHARKTTIVCAETFLVLDIDLARSREVVTPVEAK